MEQKKEKVAQLRKSMHNYYERQREDQSRKNEIVKSLYDKPIEVEFKQNTDINMEKFFRFPGLQGGCNWSPIAKAVYVVLCSKADFIDPEKWFHLSRENIGKLSGLSPKTVDKGIKELKWRGINGRGKMLETEKRQEKGRWLLYHKVLFNRETDENKQGYFVFNTSIIESGVWAKISLRAKALYIAHRETAYFDRELFLKLKKEVEVKPDEPEKETNPDEAKNTREAKAAETEIEDRKKCPGGHRFGTDNDQYDACDTCKIWDDCADESDIRGFPSAYSFKDDKPAEYNWLVNSKSVTDLCRTAKISTSHHGELIKELESVGLVENYKVIRIVHTHPLTIMENAEV